MGPHDAVERSIPIVKPPVDTLDIAADRLSGAKQIATFLGMTPRRAVYLLETGQIPAGKEGRIWVASRQVLRDHYRQLTGAPAAPASTVVQSGK
jgi:hypothetical protein